METKYREYILEHGTFRQICYLPLMTALQMVMNSPFIEMVPGISRPSTDRPRLMNKGAYQIFEARPTCDISKLSHKEKDEYYQSWYNIWIYTHDSSTYLMAEKPEDMSPEDWKKCNLSRDRFGRMR